MVKRYDMEKEYSLDINIVPVEEHDGAFVRYNDYEELLEKYESCFKALEDATNDCVNLHYQLDNLLGETK